MADLYEIGMEVRRIRNVNSVNGTVFLIDNTLSAEYHDTDILEGLQEYETPEFMHTFQLNLMTIMTFMMGASEYHNPVFVTQFNERGGW